MKELHTEIEIEAPARTIWAILADTPRYADWNPFIRKMEGALAPGSQIEVILKPPGKGGLTFRPRVLVVEPERELRWLGHLVIPGIFDGEHYFLIEPLGPTRSRFIQGERFKGVLIPLLSKMIDTSTRQGFEEMNRALKIRAEMMA